MPEIESSSAKAMNMITDLLVDMQEETLIGVVREQLSSGASPKGILDALNAGMAVIGEKYAAHEYFLTELVMAAEIFSGAMQIIEPVLHPDGEDGPLALGTIVIGTVKGDLHDIGKNIFVGLARNGGFEVIDLGIDVDPQDFVDQVRECGADIVGLSGLLTMAIHSMRETIEVLRAAGLRDGVKVIIGGMSVDDDWCQQVGADAYTDDAYEGLQMAEAFMESKA